MIANDDFYDLDFSGFAVETCECEATPRHLYDETLPSRRPVLDNEWQSVVVQESPKWLVQSGLPSIAEKRQSFHDGRSEKVLYQTDDGLQCSMYHMEDML